MTKDPRVQELSARIAALCSPEQIYVFSMKYDLQQNVTSFKLCVIADTAEKRQLEQQIYCTLDCDDPYDVVTIRRRVGAVYRGRRFLCPQHPAKGGSHL